MKHTAVKRKETEPVRATPTTPGKNSYCRNNLMHIVPVGGCISFCQSVCWT